DKAIVLGPLRFRFQTFERLGGIGTIGPARGVAAKFHRVVSLSGRRRKEGRVTARDRRASRLPFPLGYILLLIAFIRNTRGPVEVATRLREACSRHRPDQLPG